MTKPLRFCPVCRLDRPIDQFYTTGFSRTRCLGCAEKAKKAEAKAQQEYKKALARVKEKYCSYKEKWGNEKQA